MVKTVAEMPKKILEAFEIGIYTRLLCARHDSYSSQLLAGALGLSWSTCRAYLFSKGLGMKTEILNTVRTCRPLF